MTDASQTREPRAVRLSRLAGQISMGLAVGFLAAMAIAELYAGVGAKAFLYEGF